MRSVNLRYIGSLLLLHVAVPGAARAQGMFAGAGLGVASVPRSLYPLCGAVRRITGPTVTLQGGYRSGRLRWGAAFEATNRGGGDAASCVPRFGTVVDSVFSPGASTVKVASLDGWYGVLKPLDVGAGVGWVPGHRSWFVSGGLGSQYRALRVEMVARRHHTSYDIVTRELGNGAPRELSRVSTVEGSWGGLIRVVVVSR